MPVEESPLWSPSTPAWLLESGQIIPETYYFRAISAARVPGRGGPAEAGATARRAPQGRRACRGRRLRMLSMRAAEGWEVGARARASCSVLGASLHGSGRG